MNVLIAYATRLGSTEAIADRIAARLEARGLDATAESVDAVHELAPYDAFVIGSAVYANHWLPGATSFARRNAAAIPGRPVWLFSSGPVGRLATRFEPADPAEITDLVAVLGARGHRVFAGAFDRGALDAARMGVMERFVARHFVPEGDYRNWDDVDRWADEIAAGLERVPDRRQA